MDLTSKNIRFIPCAHRRVTFAEHVRREALAFWRPDGIAVELPATLKEWIIRGVLRLPQISAVCWEEAERPGELAYLPIDPCDAMIEAVRLGCEFDIPVYFIDMDQPGYQERNQYVPDDLIIDKTGLAPYSERIAPYLATDEADSAQVARERWMARSLRELSGRHERLLCVLGLAHFTHARHG